jgi:predicted Zn-dependent protease
MMAGKRRLPDSDPRSQRVARLGARLARIAMAGDGGKGYTGHLADCAWRFVVVSDPEINACALPGGKVVVNSGLCDNFEGDDDALAFVIAHEIGHVTARHSAEQLTTSTAVNLIATVAQAAAAASGVPGALDRRMAEGIEGLLDMGLFRPRSREQEFEADAIGVELCARGGWAAPHGALRVFRCFDALTRAKLGPVSEQQAMFLNFLSTHPTPRDRAIAVSERAQLALGSAR